MKKTILIIISLSFIIIFSVLFFINNVKAAPSITVTSPNGGESWELSSTHFITWTQTNVNKVNLYACYGIGSATCDLIISSLETSDNTGSYNWDIPSDLLKRTDYKIHIIAWQTGVGTDSDKSDEVFIIGDGDTSMDYNIQLLSQATDETWETGKSYVIQWSNSNPDYIKKMNISLTTIDGTKWYTFSSVDSIKGQTNYSITVVAPNIDKRSDYKVKLRGEKAYDGYLTDTINSNGFINLLQVTPTPTPTPTSDFNTIEIKDGDLIRNPNAQGDARFDIYIVKLINNKKFKRLILSPKVFHSYGHLDPNKIIEVGQSSMDNYSTSDLVRAVGDSKVYKLVPNGDSGERIWISTSDAFISNGYDWDAIYEINSVDRDEYVYKGQIISSTSISAPTNIDYNELLTATVKMKCPSKVNPGEYYYGSGFIISGNRLITAAHIIEASVGDVCDIILPDTNRNATYSISVDISDRSQLQEIRQVQLQDVVEYQLPSINSNSAVASAYNNQYPYISLPFCDASIRIGDDLEFYGYPEINPNYLSNISGSIYGYQQAYLVAGDIELSFTTDEIYNYLPQYFSDYINILAEIDSSIPIMGYSGGPVINKSKKCIVGPNSGSKSFENIMTAYATWLYQVDEIVQ